MRYAIYFAPSPDSTLGSLATRWLGRDAFNGQKVKQPEFSQVSAENLSFFTAAARRYGFHGTLKAPFRMTGRHTETELVRDLESFCQNQQPVVIPEMRVTRMDDFFALVPSAPSPLLNVLASDIVMGFDRFRAQLTEDEIARRNPHMLDVSQLRNLHRWGYPHVLENFRFHMTLTGPVEARHAPRVQVALEQWFEEIDGHSLTIDSLSLFVEHQPRAPFTVRKTFELGVDQQRMRA